MVELDTISPAVSLRAHLVCYRSQRHCVPRSQISHWSRQWTCSTCQLVSIAQVQPICLPPNCFLYLFTNKIIKRCLTGPKTCALSPPVWQIWTSSYSDYSWNQLRYDSAYNCSKTWPVDLRFWGFSYWKNTTISFVTSKVKVKLDRRFNTFTVRHNSISFWSEVFPSVFVLRKDTQTDRQTDTQTRLKQYPLHTAADRK